MKKRTLVIGDIHNNFKALKQVLKRASVDFSKDKLIFLGDYVDGWPDAVKTLDLLIDIKNKSSESIFIRGNHDAWCELWLKTGTVKSNWKHNGGMTTLPDLINKKDYTKYLSFFNSLNNYYVDDKLRAFVHGGFSSEDGLGHETSKEEYYWNRNLFENALILNNSWGKIKLPVYDNYKEIYLGHTATVIWKYKHNGVLRITDNTNPDCKVGKRITTPINACNIWNMDTGGGFYGKLTIMDIDTKEYWQSDYGYDLYPDVKSPR